MERGLESLIVAALIGQRDRPTSSTDTVGELPPRYSITGYVLGDPQDYDREVV